MAKFAYIVDGKIDSVYDFLPDNWQNFSNFYALENDEAFLKSLGWYKVTKIVPEIDPERQHYGEVIRWIENDVVYETEEVIDNPIVPEPLKPSEEELLERQWAIVRQHRDELISSFDWRYLRYHREIRLGLTPTDDIVAMDTYIQSLADLPETQTDPFNIIWPSYSPANVEVNV